jgi:hypothetical protein
LRAYLGRVDGDVAAIFVIAAAVCRPDVDAEIHARHGHQSYTITRKESELGDVSLHPGNMEWGFGPKNILDLHEAVIKGLSGAVEEPAVPKASVDLLQGTNLDERIIATRRTG